MIIRLKRFYGFLRVFNAAKDAHRSFDTQMTSGSQARKRTVSIIKTAKNMMI